MTRFWIWTLAALVAGAPLHTIAQSKVTVATAPKSSGATVTGTQVLPGTRSDAFATIRGSVIDSDGAPLADAVVRLRDARFGRIVDTTVTDKAGLFAFGAVDPGSYIVEVMGPDHSVLVASEIINVNAGDAKSAILILPFRTPALAGVLSHSTTSAALVLAVAAASGVLATAVAGQSVSPPG